MEHLRNFSAAYPRMKDNFRAVQPLNGRTIYDVDTSKAPKMGLSYLEIVFILAFLFLAIITQPTN